MALGSTAGGPDSLRPKALGIAGSCPGCHVDMWGICQTPHCLEEPSQLAHRFKVERHDTTYTVDLSWQSRFADLEVCSQVTPSLSKRLWTGTVSPWHTKVIPASILLQPLDYIDCRKKSLSCCDMCSSCLGSQNVEGQPSSMK